jgi:murein DD-endopeptidase MepM/ murein hydrolase activator NlpD
MKKYASKAWAWFMLLPIKTKAYIVLGFIAAFFVIQQLIKGKQAETVTATKEFPFSPVILPRQVIRVDSSGNGNYLASRDGGTRNHAGIDILVTKGQTIYAPFDGKLTRIYNVYVGDSKYKGLEIVSNANGFKIKIMYCIAYSDKIGFQVRSGEPIAYAQAIVEKYGGSMQNHLHVELYQNETRIDPTLHLQVVK